MTAMQCADHQMPVIVCPINIYEAMRVLESAIACNPKCVGKENMVA